MVIAPEIRKYSHHGHHEYPVIEQQLYCMCVTFFPIYCMHGYLYPCLYMSVYENLASMLVVCLYAANDGQLMHYFNPDQSLIQTETAQQLLGGMPRYLVYTFMVIRG